MFRRCLKGLLALIAVYMSFGASAALCADTPSLERNNDSVRLRLKWKHQFQFAGCYAALEKGYFSELGLDVELIEGGVDSPVEAVLDGQADFGIAGPELLQSRLNGADVVALAVIMQQTPSTLISLFDSEISSVSDLRNRRLMLYSAPRSVEISSMLMKGGLADGQYEVLPLNGNAMQLLIAGKVDAIQGYTTNEPFLLHQLGYETRLLNPSDENVDFYGDTLFTTEREIRDHPARVMAMRQALLRGWQYAYDHPDEIAALIRSKYNPQLDAEQLEYESRLTLTIVNPPFSDIGQMSSDRWRHMAEYMQVFGMVDELDRLDGMMYSDYDILDPDVSRMRRALLALALAAVLAFGLLLFFNLSLRRAVQFRTRELTELNRQLNGQLEQNHSVLQELEKHRRGYAEAQRIARVGNWSYDVVSGELDWSEEVFRIYGLDPQITPSLADALEVTHEDDRSMLRIALRDAIRDGQPGSIVRRIHYADGRIGYANTVFEPVMNGQGRTVMLRGTVQDVTEIRLAQEAREQSEQAYNALFDNSIELIFVVDPQGRLIEANDNALQRFGFGRADLGKLGLQDITSRNEHNRAMRGITEVLTGERRGALQEFSATTRSGERIWYESAGVRLERDGQPWAVLVVARDITDRKHAEAERRHLESQLRQTQKLEAIGTLAGGIAHDFNNLLFAIRGNADLALTLPGDEENTRECLAEILAASARATELVQQILSFARKSEVEMRVVDLNQTFAEVLRLIRATIPASIEIVSELSHGENLVYGDVTQMHQLMMNLCSNAGYAMREKGGRLTIRLRRFGPVAEFGGRVMDPASSYLMISVEDTGTGISEKVRERIFEPFFTTKGMGEGTGMGLSAVHGIVVAMKGAIEVQSTLGVGTTFNILLPEAQPEMLELPTLRRDVPRGHERVLVVDDEEAIVRVMYTSLSNLGYSVTACTGSKDALEKFRLSPDGFDLVISDQAMPGMTGNQLAQEIRGIRDDLPIIICSGNNTAPSTEEGERAGVAMFLHKPVERRELAEAIRSLLD
ncbi:MAG: ABC transporter substrate-binding protein [Planctomycetales bacterium]|nr:ABC transporter substrate-binding protein [bacterium]UNM09734.1 MAG: ABC transporter substrate-binding protein [Planctomycetales bacterium]